MDLSMNIRGKSMDMDTDGKFHIHGNPNHCTIYDFRCVVLVILLAGRTNFRAYGNGIVSVRLSVVCLLRMYCG